MAAVGTDNNRSASNAIIISNDPALSPPYTHCRIGCTAASSAGRMSAHVAMNASSTAYARSALAGVIDEAERPAVQAPTANPPMNAASRMPTAREVCPMESVSSRSQTTSYNSAAAPDSR